MTSDSITEQAVERGARRMWRDQHGHIWSHDSVRTPESDERECDETGYGDWDVDRVSASVKDAYRDRFRNAAIAAGLLAHQAPATEDGPTLPALLREYGAAIRGDWSDIDGRSVRDDLDSVASWAESGSVPTSARQTLGLCSTGGGHWEYHCEPECDPPVTPEPSGFEGTRSALGALTIRKDQTND